MSLNSIKISLLDHLKTIVGLPTIHYPNMGADIPTDGHIVPYVIPSDTMPVGLRTTDKESGIFQVSIFVKKGSGEILALDIAETILQGFPRNLQLDNVCIDRSGSIGRSFYEDNWQITPVTIRYRNFT